MAINKANIGSGIGEGATIKLPSIVTNPTGLDVKFGSTIDPTKIASDTVNRIGGATAELGASAVGIVNSLGKNVSSFVSGIGDKISALAGTPADPSAIGAKVGLDVSQLSGIGATLQSKVLSQISSFGKNLPAGVNLNQAANAGVVLDYIPPDKIKNIPPSAPYSTAPPVQVDVEYVKEVAAKGGATALANLYGVSSVNELSGNLLPSDVVNSALRNIPTSQTNPFSNIVSQYNAIDVNSLKDKLSSAQSQIAGLTGKVAVLDQGVIGSVSARFGSSSLAQSPLSKLINGT